MLPYKADSIIHFYRVSAHGRAILIEQFRPSVMGYEPVTELNEMNECPSVCPLRSGIVLKRLNIAYCYSFFTTR